MTRAVEAAEAAEAPIPGALRKMRKALKQKEAKLESLRGKLDAENNKICEGPLPCGGVAFVTFSSAEHAQDCAKAMPANWLSLKNPCVKSVSLRLKVGEKPLYSTEAPDPEDIKWENLEISLWKQFWTFVFHNCIAGTICVIGIVIIIVCQLIQLYTEDNDGKLVAHLGKLIAVIVTMTTGAMTKVTETLSKKEKVHTTSQMEAVFVFRSVGVSFLLGPYLAIVVPWITGKVRTEWMRINFELKFEKESC
jgi:hypothetical protein